MTRPCPDLDLDLDLEWDLEWDLELDNTSPNKLIEPQRKEPFEKLDKSLFTY